MGVNFLEILFNRWMTGSADRYSLAFHAQWICRSGWIMTFSTFLAGKGLVCIFLDQLAAIRSVGIVTGHAISALYRIIKVRFFRDRMACHAYPFRTLFNQFLIIGRMVAVAS